MPSSPPPISISTNAASTAADITISSPTASDKSPAPRSKEHHQNTSTAQKSQPLNDSKSSRNVLNAKSNGKASQKSDAADRGDDGDSENPGEPPSTPPHSNHDRSDSEAETIVIPGSRMRRHRNRLFKNESGEVSQRNGASNSSGRMTNGDSKGKDHDKDGEDDDGDSSVLSSPPTSPLPPNTSKGGSGKNGTLGRSSTANLSNGNRGRILHRRTNSSSSTSRNLSPPLKQRSSRRDTSNENNPRSRNSRKRKGRSGSPPRKRRGSNDEVGRHGNEDRSPTRGIRVKSSPPVSPPPPPSSLLPPPPPPDKYNNASSSPSNSLLPSPLPNNNHNGSSKRHSSHGSVGHHHTRNKSSTSAALASPSKTSQSGRSLKSKRLPAPLRISRGVSADDRSTSSSRSTSPQTMPRLRRPSLSGSAASPVRAMAGGHKPKRDNAGRTHFFKHCAKGHLDEAVQLLNGETEPLFEADNAGYLPIHAAALGGYTETVKFLIQAGSPIDVAAKDLSTPLLDAVENLHLEVVVLLLEAGADPRKRNENGQTVIDVAASLRKNDPDNAKEMEVIEKHLQTAVAKLRSKRSSDDENARGSAALESSSSRAASVASPVHQSPPPSALAHTSSSRRRTGRSEITRNDLLWLDSGKGGMQKLRDASRTGDIEMVGKLLESGNNPDVDSVVLAAKGGHADVLNILLAFGADSDPDPQESSRHLSKEKGGSSLPPGEDTPLLATIGRGNLNILRLLLKSDTMKDPRRTDKKGRTYMDIARDRAGDNWEEEVKILQKAYDDAAPRSKKSLRDKSARDISPSTSRKSGVPSASALKQKTSSLKENEPSSAKPTKRARRGSVTDEAPTQTHAIGDTINVSSREPTPRLKASAAASKATEKEQRDREREKDKRREKERRDSEGNDSLATAADPVKKKRRLISGKDLANASSQSQPSKTGASASSKSSKKSKAEEDDTDMPDLPPPPVPASKKGSISDDKERPVIKRERERSTDSSLPAKRHRESSTSSLNRVKETDKSSDVERATIKKRRKLEESAERSGSGTDKEKTKVEAIEKRRREKASSLSKDSPEPQQRERRSKDVLEKRRAREVSETTSTTSATVTEAKERKSERRERREREIERENLKEEKRRERERGDREKTRDPSKDKIKEREKERSSKLREKEEEREAPRERERDRESKLKDRSEREKEKLREKLREKKRAERERERDNNTENDEESEKPAKDSSSEASKKKKKRRDDDEARKDVDGDIRMKEEPVDDDSAVLRTKEVPMKEMDEEHDAEEAARKAKEAEEEIAAQRAKAEAEAAAKELARCDVLTQEIRAQQEKARAEGEAAAAEFAILKEKELERQRLEEEARLQAEAAEKARLEKEAREKQAAEEAQRRKAEEEARLEAERIAKEKEEEAKRLALEEEMRQKRIAEEKEREAKRIEALPWVLREAAKVQDKHAYVQNLLSNKKYFSLYVADLDNLTASKPLARPAPEDLYISSLQAVILLGVPEDLELRQYPGLNRKDVTLEDRHQLRNILQPLYTRDISLHTPSDYKIYDIKSAWEMKNAEGDKFESLKELYWIKVADFLKTLKANEKQGNFTDAFVYQYLSRTS